MFLQVYLPAIRGHVPPQMVRCLSAFLEFCYLVRRDSISETALEVMDTTLTQFHAERVIFQESGVRRNFNLPRQHSLIHYRRSIQLFGAPNGLCTSITKSKHIVSVKEPWRWSNHFQALGQMLITNQRLEKLSASRVDFISRGLLSGTLPVPPNMAPAFGDPDAVPVAGPKVLNIVTLAVTRGTHDFFTISV